MTNLSSIHGARFNFTFVLIFQREEGLKIERLRKVSLLNVVDEGGAACVRATREKSCCKSEQ